jgi:hypothetical protein
MDGVEKSVLSNTLKILHFALMMMGTIGVRGMGELILRHISD